MNLETMLRDQLVLFLVQKQIFCPIGKDVLDVRTCVVILDADDDPYMVFSPKGWQALVDAGVPLQAPYHVDESTVRP